MTADESGLLSASAARVFNAPIQTANTWQPAHPSLGHRQPVEASEQLDRRMGQGLVRAAFSTAPGPDEPDARLAWRRDVHHRAVRACLTDLDPSQSGHGLPPEVIVRRIFGADQ